MTIRNKLALRLMLLASLILGVALLVVYSMSARYRIEEFQARMYERGAHTARLLLQVEEVDEQLLSRMERDSPTQVPGEAVRIYDRDGQEVFTSGKWRRGKIGHDLLERVREAEDPVDMQEDGESIGFTFMHDGAQYVVLVAGEDRFGRSKLRNLRSVMLITYGFGILITFIVGRVYAQRALEPLKRLVGEVRGMHGGDLKQRVQVGEEEDEITQLARSFNELLERLEMAFNAQRDFIANASHELRTPLTVISGQLEVLLLMDRTTEDYRKAVNSVLEDMRALNRLSNRLLLLAQAGSRSSEAQFSPVRIDEIIWQARAELLRANKGNSIDVAMSEVEEERYMQVLGNENLLRSLVFNLMENGCKYSADKHVEVELVLRPRRLIMEFRDHGIGIPARDRDRVFSAFFRGSNTSGYKGHGIGLSLVRKIAELHGGSVTFRDNDGGGTVFTVTLPHL